MTRSVASVLAHSASTRLTVSIRSTTRKLTRLSCSGTFSSIPPSPTFSGCSCLSVLLARSGQLNPKHVGGAADESGERAAQQDHHTAGTRSEDIGNVTESQANCWRLTALAYRFWLYRTFKAFNINELYVLKCALAVLQFRFVGKYEQFLEAAST